MRSMKYVFGIAQTECMRKTLLNVIIVKPCSVKSVHSLIKVNIAGVVTIHCVKRTKILAHFSGPKRALYHL